MLVFNAAAPFVEASQFDGAIVDLPESVIDRLEAGVSSAKTWLTLTHAFCQRMPPLRLTLRSSKWPGYSSGSVAVIGAWGWLIVRGRWLHAETLVGAFGVEFVAEGGEAPLLRAAVAGGWARGGRLEGVMHAFMSRVLLGMAGLDQFRLDAALEQPDAQLGEACKRVACGGDSGCSRRRP